MTQQKIVTPEMLAATSPADITLREPVSPPPAIMLCDDDGPYVTIKPGGEVILRDGLAISDAARGFWEKLAEAFPPFKEAIEAALSTAPEQQPVARSVCAACKGKGTEADWVGLQMHCIEVECSFCNGTGLTAPPTPEPAPADELREENERLRRLADARKAWLDAAATYNARLAVVKAERERGNHSMRVDDEYCAMNDAQRVFWKIAQEVADAAITGGGNV